MRVGSCDIVALFDGTGREPAAEVLRRAGSVDPWAAHRDTLDDNGDLVLAVGGYLVRTGDGRIIVVDAGVGTIDNGRYRGGQFLDSLAAAGVQPGDVTDVVFTHLHFDHVGWATKKGEVVFPNATYRVHRADWEHFVTQADAEPGAVRKLTPIADRLELFDGEVELAAGFTAREMPGHTPGSTIFLVGDESQRAVFIGDLAHTPVELIEPDWQFIHDHDAHAATRARTALVEEFADTAIPIFAAHFPDLRPGVLRTESGALQWTYL
jgi:glyoxylase-like metal-dependent hydrolase (beta-lactamase superfamily II)